MTDGERKLLDDMAADTDLPRTAAAVAVVLAERDALLNACKGLVGDLGDMTEDEEEELFETVQILIARAEGLAVPS